MNKMIKHLYMGLVNSIKTCVLCTEEIQQLTGRRDYVYLSYAVSIDPSTWYLQPDPELFVLQCSELDQE